MGENLSIFKKGLVLVAIPLLFQLGFIALMVQMRQRRWMPSAMPALGRAWGTGRGCLEFGPNHPVMGS
jgi:hypothetical protein